MSVNPTTPHTQPWSANKSLKVVNMFGGPGCGKSTVAADLFSLMKRSQFKVELIHEIAKDHVWERWNHIFREQDYIFAHQHRLQRRLVGHDIDYCVIDSSMLLGLFYTPDDFPPSFKTFVREVYDSYDNINIFLTRSDKIPYVQEGRNQDYNGALALDQQIKQYFIDEKIDFIEVESGGQAAAEILEVIRDHP